MADMFGGFCFLFFVLVLMCCWLCRSFLSLMLFSFCNCFSIHVCSCLLIHVVELFALLLWYRYIVVYLVFINTYTNWTCSRIPGSGIQAKRTIFLSLLAVCVKVKPFWHWMTLESPVWRGINCPQDLEPPFGVRACTINPRKRPPCPWIETVKI